MIKLLVSGWMLGIASSLFAYLLWFYLEMKIDIKIRDRMEKIMERK